MTGLLKIRDPGLQTSLQDGGRRGVQRLGVPVAGALDSDGLTLANQLVGNAPETAALEILVAGPTIEVDADSVRVALAGAGATMEVVEGETARTVPAWRSVRLERGAVLRVAALPQTLCAYLAVEGGFAVTPVMGSASTYVRSGLGGFDGRAVAAGDALPLRHDAAEARPEQMLCEASDPGQRQAIRVVLGPQDDYFTDAAVAAFLEGSYTVSASADRMGMRLDGPTLEHRDGFDIVSDGIAPGAVQVPGSGQPIVLLADRQTTGGYPKIATVISADLPVIGRRRPGDEVRFAAVDLAEALEIRRSHDAWLAGLVEGMTEVHEPVAGLADSLYRENLISGVVTGVE